MNALILLAALVAVPPLTQDPRMLPSAVSAPLPGTSALSASFEGGKDGKKLTAKATFGFERLGLELQAAGADLEEKSGVSRVLQSHDLVAGGAIGAGLTWSSFSVEPRSEYLKLLQELCPRAGRTPPPKPLEEALGKDARLGDLEALASALEELARDAAAPPGARSLALAARARASTARLAFEQAWRKAHAAECNQRDDLDPARLSAEDSSRLDALSRWQPSYLLLARAEVGSQFTKYFDTASGKAAKEQRYPWSARVGAGTYLRPTLLVGLSLGYQELRDAAPTSQVCQDLQVGGVTTTPPTLRCASLVVGRPQWKPSRLARLEVRQYLDDLLPGLAWNPAVTVSAAGALDASVKRDAVRFDVPVYLLLGSGEKAFTLGVAWSGYLDSGERVNELSVFLASRFQLRGFSK